MDENLKRLLEKLTINKDKLDRLRPFSPGIMAKLKEFYDVESTYNSNAIEGNTLGSGETRLVILEGVTIGGKSVKEHLEAINHKKAIDYLEQVVQKSDKISEDIINKVHALILREIDDQNAGNCRNTKVYISGSRYVPPDPLSVPLMMKDFVHALDKKINAAHEHPVIIAADAHYELVRIHPYIDGNGRVARLLMNFILIGAGYPPVIIPFSRREEYIKSLEAANAGKRDPFYLLIAEAEEASLARYLSAVVKVDK